MNEQTIVTVQARGRVTLGKLATARHYLAHAEPDGTLVLEPAEVITAAEARLLANDHIVSTIDANIADPDRLVTRDRSKSPRS
jgi:hypothetical protein